MYLSIPAGATSKIVQVPVYDSASVVGALLAGLVYNTASLTAYYNREGAAGAAVAISLVTATKGTWTSGGFVAVDGTNQPGVYELHIPDAALAAGAKSVVIYLKGAANMVPAVITIELTAVSNQDSLAGGMTILPSMAGATFDAATDSLEAIRNRGDAAWTSGAAQALPYAPTSIAFTIGDDESPAGETFADLAAHDDTHVQCGEVAGTGLEFEVLATLVGKQSEVPTLARIAAFYNGSAAHELSIEAYNYVTAAYEHAATMKSRTSSFDYVIPLEAENHDPANGSMKIRFKHSVATYNASHYLRVDYVSFEKRAVTDALASDVAAILAAVNEIDLEGAKEATSQLILADTTSATADLIASLVGSQLAQNVLVSRVAVVGDTIELQEKNVKTLTFDFGASWDLTGKKLLFTVKQNKDDALTAAILNTDITAGVTNAAEGEGAHVITVPDAGDYFYEYTRYDADGTSNPETVMLGVLRSRTTVRKP